MDEFDRRFNKAFREMEQHMDRMLRSGPSMVSVLSNETWRPSVDVYEIDAGLVVFIETAGIDPASLSVIAGRRTITISGERRLPHLEGIRSVHQLEIDQGCFKRTIQLPVPVDVTAVSSTFRDGILEVKLPREQPMAKVRIRVD